MAIVEDLMEALDKEIGKNSTAQAVTKFVDTGYPPLNKIISGKYDGGLPFGRMIEIYGDSSTGKSALASQFMINAQKMGGVAIFIDWERSFDVEMAKANGLNDERPYWIYARPKTWEEGNIIATKACQLIRKSKVISEEAPIVAIFDSIAAAIPQSAADKEIDELTMNDTSALARVTSTTLKTQAQRCGEFDATYIYLNQTREKLNVTYGDKTCLRGDVNIPFTDGTSDSIKNIVDNKIDKLVWSFNEKEGKFEEKKIIGWINNGEKRSDVDWIHIRTKGRDTRNGVIGGTFTGDHKILTQRGWVRADEVSTSDSLVSKRKVSFVGTAKDFLIAVLNFDSHLSTRDKKSSTAALILSDNIDPEYSKWKAEKLSNHLRFKCLEFIFKEKNFNSYYSEYTSELKSMIDLARNPLKSFKDGMTDLQLAIMIMDDGSLSKSESGEIYSVSIRRLSGDVEAIDEMCNIFGKMGLANTPNYGCGKFHFSKKATLKIAERICKYVPECMRRKLPKEYWGFYEEFSLDEPKTGYVIDMVEVLEVKNRNEGKRSKYSLTYDLTIEGNHNYLVGNKANGFVVHNCTPGGKAMEFYSTVRLSLTRQKIIDAEKEMIGQSVNIKCAKSKLTAPFKTASLKMSFDETGMASFDFIGSALDYLTEQGVFSPKGWIEYDGSKFQGRKNLAKHIAEKNEYHKLIEMIKQL